jgi:hypothetical protein
VVKAGMSIAEKKDTLVGHMQSHDHMAHMLTYRAKQAKQVAVRVQADNMDKYLKVSSAV